MISAITIKSQLKAAILLMASFSLPVFAESLNDLKMVGQGKMSWLFMDIYQASLLSEDGHYQEKKYPQALTIRYQRNFTKKSLLKATQQEWQKLSVEQTLNAQWLAELSRIWPEITEGDSLTFLVSENGNGDFYHNDKWLGQINNSDFSAAFLSIWLSEKTSEPELRRQLIGEIR